MVFLMVNVQVCQAVYCSGTTAKYSRKFTYTCHKHQTCCGSGCCDKVYAVWYVWVILLLSILLCCGAGWFIKRKKKIKSRINHSCTDRSDRKSKNTPNNVQIFLVQGARAQGDNSEQLQYASSNNRTAPTTIVGRSEPPPPYNSLE